MLGIILCGGQSLRMGNDKGLLKQDAKYWATIAAGKLTCFDIPVKFSVNKEQYPVYATVFSPNDLIKDNLSVDAKGPLLGLLSCHLLYPGEDLFVLACDMLMMDSSIPGLLLKHYKENPGAEAYFFMNEKEPEPLCCIYTAGGLSVILRMLKKGELEKFSMKFILDQLTKKSIALQDNEKIYFSNFNTHADLNGL
ncbi:MAG: NTP transferase domain-containing protein [Ferruginibacter sp.]